MTGAYMIRHIDNVRTKHLVQSIVFFILALNAIALMYMLADSNGIFSRMASARIARMLDGQETRQAQEPTETSSNSAEAAPTLGTLPPTVADASSSNDSAHPSRALTMIPVMPISATGACVAVENFKSDIQVKSAKALLASSPLRDKSWLVSTPVPAMYLAGVQTDSAASSRKIAKNLAKMGLAPLSMSANFVGLAKADTASAASELAAISAAGLQGSKIVSRLISQATEKHSIVTLPQSRLETQFATSLTSRLPGVSLSAIPCPELATALLSIK
jgi:hypothetical protein